MPKPIIQVENLSTQIDGHWIHRDLNFTVEQGEIVAIVGGSGAGKSTLLNCLLLLLPPAAGTIKIFDENIETLDAKDKEALRTRCSIMFQGGALFSELTVAENVLFPMLQHSHLEKPLLTKLAILKILMAGLNEDAAPKYPDELSGGMIKRAAVARALALDPELLFLDEPSSGLDPITASGLDKLILELRDSLKLTIVIVTHDLDTLATVPDRIAFIGQGKVLACDTLANLIKSDIPEVQDYFNNARAKRTFGA